MQGVQEISMAQTMQPTVISAEDLKALLYLTIRGHNGLTPGREVEGHIDAEKGVDVQA